MYYLIRWLSNNEVAGILNTRGDILYYSSVGVQSKIIDAIKEYFHTERYFRWETITKAEYETYRDLHGFEVIRCSS